MKALSVSFGKVYFFAVLLMACVGILVLQLFVFPVVKSCVFSGFSAVGSSLQLSSRLISLLLQCGSEPLSAFFVFPLLFFLSLFSSNFFANFSGFMAAVFASKKKSLLFLAVFFALVTSFYLAPGDVLVGDAGPFQAATYSYYDSFKQGLQPFFTFDWYGGSMHFFYYGPLYFVVSGTVNLIFHDVNITTKLLLWLFHIASGIVFFVLALRLTRNKVAALISGMLYALAFEHVASIMIVGRFLNAFVYVTLPLTLLVLEGMISGVIGTRRGTVLLAMLMSAVFLTSPADAVYSLAVFGVYALVRLWQMRRKALFVSFALSLVMFLLLSSFWFVPFYIEKQHVNGSARVLNELTPSPSAVTLARLAVWPGFWGQSRVYYVALSAVVLSLFSAYCMLKKRYACAQRLQLYALGIAVLLSFALVVLVSGRAGSGLVLFLSLMAAFGVLAVLSYRSFFGRVLSQKTLAAVLFAVVLVDILPAAFQPSYADFSHEKSVFASLPRDGYSARLLDLHTTYRTYYPYVAYLTTGLPVLFGPIPEGAPPSFSYYAAIANLAAHEVYDESASFSDTTLDGLFLLDVGYVVLHGEQVGVSPSEAFASKRYSFGLERNISVLKLPHSPIIASGRIAGVPESPPMERVESFFTKPLFNMRKLNWSYTSKLIDGMGVDTVAGTAAVIFVKGADDAAVADNVSVRLLGLSANPRKVIINVSSDSPAFVQLSYAYYPWLTVRVNGEKVAFMRTAMNLMAVKVNRGISEIVIEGTLSKWHRRFGILSGAALAACLVLLLLPHRKSPSI